MQDTIIRMRRLFPALLAVAVALSASSVAVAEETRVPESFSPLVPPAGITITSPGAVAIDEATGNVFVAHGSGAANSSVFILGGEGGAPAGLVSPYSLTGFNFIAGTNGIAYDNSAISPNKGTLYVVTPAVPADATKLKIKKFTRSPLTEKYELAGELTASGPGLTFGTGSANAGATVDTEGNLFVGEFTCKCIVKFDPTGIQEKSYDLASHPIIRPTSPTVDASGDLIVANSGAGSVYEFPADGSGEIDPTVSTEILSSGARGIAIDSVRDKLYALVDGSPGDRVFQYDATTLAKDFEFGAGALGNTARRVAANPATDRIYVSDDSTGKDNIAAFGPPVPLPTVTTKAASGITGTKATLNASVNPEGFAVTECFFEYGLTTAYGSTKPCEGAIPTDSSDHTVTVAIDGLESDGATYHFRVVAKNANGTAHGADKTLVTGSTAFTEPATGITGTSATLNGIVRPEGEQITGCVFEYGTALDYGQSIPCSPPAATIPDSFDPYAVSANPSGLLANTTYHFRLTKTDTDGTVHGEDRTFTIRGPPQIVEQRPLDATQTGVILQARIDPSGSPTTYHFEFGTDTSYGTRIPADHELFAGSGAEPVAVSADRGGLEESSVYWFRVVATNASGTTVGPDQRLETLNEHGLPNGRAFELVTPADKGSSGSVAVDISGQQSVQASVDGESLVYPLTNGLPTSTAGGWLRQRAGRTATGWLSTQISAPTLIPPPGYDEVQKPSMVHTASPGIDCGFLESYNPLTEDTPQVGIELGVTNLYRWNADGSYELITSSLPLNPGVAPGSNALFFGKVDASDDCSRVLFASRYEYIPDASGLYEWDEGTLRDAGVLPNGEAGDGAVLGGEVDGRGTARWNAVSPDGSRVFFTAIANEGPSDGRPAIFMREERGASYEECEEEFEFEGCVIEVSASETAVSTNGARFEAASPDGERVFFRANYGIADTSSAGPTSGDCGPLGTETEFSSVPVLEEKSCDLYVYDIEDEDLIDLSADANSADAGVGAQIQGAVAVDEDGSHAYFAALGQLVPGKGRTYAENTAGFGSANVYLAREGQPLEYVTTLAEHGPAPNAGGARTGDLLGFDAFFGAALMRRATAWVANTSDDGGELLFMSSRNLTGWESGGIDKYAAYLFSAETGRLVCISCRPDGLPSVAESQQVFEAAQSSFLLANPGGTTNSAAFVHRPRSLSENGSRVLFSTPDVLAPGAVAGKRNVYEWQEGQVFFLAVADGAGHKGLEGYVGSSNSGDDVFIASGERLVPQDNDFLSDVYDVRAGGGYPEEVQPPDCQVDEAVPLLANQIYCQGGPSPQPPTPAPVSPNLSGSGNPPIADPPTPKPCGKGKVRRRGKCVKRPKRGPKHERKRAAKTNSGGAK